MGSAFVSRQALYRKRRMGNNRLPPSAQPPLTLPKEMSKRKSVCVFLGGKRSRERRREGERQERLY